MPPNISRSDLAAGASIALGVIAVFLPWYSYTEAGTRITVNGFRASLLGDAFFLAVALSALLLLMQRDLVSDVLGGRVSARVASAVLAALAIASVLDQLLLTGGGRAIAPGLIVALLVAAGLAAAAWLRSIETRPASARVGAEGRRLS